MSALYYHDQSGFTLVEVMAAIVVIGLLIGPVFLSVSGGLTSAEIGAAQTTAAGLAQEKMEKLRATSFYDLIQTATPIIEDPVQENPGFKRVTEIEKVSKNLIEINVTIIWNNGKFKVTTLRAKGEF